MLVIYICGPFRAPTDWGRVQNIRRAEAAALEVWRAGMVALCPHMNTANFDGAAPDGVWLAGDLELLRRCDAVLLVEGWDNSSGARAEIVEAKRWLVPVFEEIEQLRLWQSRAVQT